MKSASIPAAIVLGLAIFGAFIGAGIYFGLRAHGDDASSRGAHVASADDPGATHAASGDARSASTLPALPGVAPSVDRNAASAQVTREIEALRSTLIGACWQPSFAKKATPPSTEVVFDVTFDAAGRELSRGLNEDPVTGRPDVTFCVQKNVPALHIDPQGASVHLRVPLTLP